jgi:hypothetical protein
MWLLIVIASPQYSVKHLISFVNSFVRMAVEVMFAFGTHVKSKERILAQC